MLNCPTLEFLHKPLETKKHLKKFKTSKGVFLQYKNRINIYSTISNNYHIVLRTI